MNSLKDLEHRRWTYTEQMPRVLTRDYHCPEDRPLRIRFFRRSGSLSALCMVNGALEMNDEDVVEVKSSLMF